MSHIGGARKCGLEIKCFKVFLVPSRAVFYLVLETCTRMYLCKKAYMLKKLVEVSGT